MPRSTSWWLLTPKALEQMSRRIQGMAPGAGISEMSPRAIRGCGLDTAGYHFENGTEDDCIAVFVEAVHSRQWVVMPCWHPQALHTRFRIRLLQDPLLTLGATDNATLLVRRDTKHLVSAAALGDLHYGNTLITELDPCAGGGRPCTPTTRDTDYSR